MNNKSELRYIKWNQEKNSYENKKHHIREEIAFYVKRKYPSFCDSMCNKPFYAILCHPMQKHYYILQSTTFSQKLWMTIRNLLYKSKKKKKQALRREKYFTLILTPISLWFNL